MNLNEKQSKLEEILKSYEKVAIAFSSGVDSSFLLAIAGKILNKKNVLAITIQSEIISDEEINLANQFCKDRGINHKIVQISISEIPNFEKNPPNRCYICKKILFQKIIDVAAENGIEIVCDGSNFDDSGDYRPGVKAIEELGIQSPLKLAEMTKDDIRTLSMQMRLPTWNKPSKACLASRFAYNEPIMFEHLKIVESCEKFLQDLGIQQSRVRFHGSDSKIKIARIEVSPSDFQKLIDAREKILMKFKIEGFNYITLDLQGFRSGSMNEILSR